MIGVSLKSQKAATYIDQIMGLNEEAQEFLGSIVEDCLGSIEEDTNTGRSSNQGKSNRTDNVDNAKHGDSDNEELKKDNPLH